MSDERWRRLHPLSPLIRAGRGTFAIVILLVPDLAEGHSISGAVVQLAIVALLVLLGAISWLVTRWRIAHGDLQIESGLLRRRSLRFPLAQVQAVDVVRPGLARLFGVAELRLRMAGASSGSARLAYLANGEVEPLRRRLLELANAVPSAEETPADVVTGDPADADAAGVVAPERVLTSVSPWRLIAAILISAEGLTAEVVIVALAVAGFAAPTAASAIAGGGAASILGGFTYLWRRFNQEYRLTVAEAPDGLRLRSGLIALSAGTIRPGRVQEVRMVEPLLWRPLGWCRLEVNLAGRQRSKGEGQAERGQLRTLLPVGSRAHAIALLEHVLPDVPPQGTELRPPSRARLKSPLRYRFLGWARSESVVVTTSGRLRRVTVWVPLGKVQSLRRVQGPVQRRLRLASVHLDTAGRSLEATLRDRDVDEADRVLGRLVELSRVARARPL